MAIDPNSYQSLVDSTFAGDDPNHAAYGKELSHAGDVFSSQFQNMVGRAPNQDEINQFYSQWAAQNKGVTNPGNDLQLGAGVQQFVGSNFHKAAQDYATQQLQDQQGQANSLSDLFRSQGNAAISDTEQSLLDYQSKLFDKLRPNLITSLKSQGLLDTGGMNEAMAGVQGDLANNASQYIAGLKLQNDQGANQIAFSGAAAPYQFQQQQIMGAPSFSDQTGAGATAFNNNTFMSNLDFQHQMALQHAQAQNQQGLMPSFLRTFGQSSANGLGSNLTQWTGPGTYSSQGKSGATGLGAII